MQHVLGAATPPASSPAAGADAGEVAALKAGLANLAAKLEQVTARQESGSASLERLGSEVSQLASGQVRRLTTKGCRAALERAAEPLSDLIVSGFGQKETAAALDDTRLAQLSADQALAAVRLQVAATPKALPCAAMRCHALPCADSSVVPQRAAPPPVPAAAAAAAATTPARAGPRSRLAEVEAARRLVSCSPCRNYRLPAIEWPYSPTDCVCRIAGCRSGRPIAGGNSVKKRPATLMRPALE